MFQIVQADTPEALAFTAALFREYAASLSVDLAFQNFEKELADLPGEYAPPKGRLLLAMLGNPSDRVHAKGYANSSTSSASSISSASCPPSGCIALRKMDATSCEMKRLYIRPEFRGRGIGRALAEAVIAAAREIGYQRMRLDTLPEMSRAQILYESLGFNEIPSYRFNPVPGTRFLELTL